MKLRFLWAGGPKILALIYCKALTEIAGARQAQCGSRQVGVGTKRGAELASHVFRCLIESPRPKENVILKIVFENAFNSIKRQFMLEKTFEIHPEDNKYSQTP